MRGPGYCRDRSLLLIAELVLPVLGKNTNINNTAIAATTRDAM